MLDINRLWYQKSLHPLCLLLLPFSWLFAVLVFLRRLFYQRGWFTSIACNVPIIVVGNISVGGTGKTPLVLWLTDLLRTHGYQPGIVTRGIGGKMQRLPRAVTKDAEVKEVGDEALLLANNADVPVVIGIDRVKAVEFLLAHHACDVVISDDGLQHYRLQRQIEIAVVDGKRWFGNGLLLPAGPLRESLQRLAAVDFIVVNHTQEETQILNDKQTYKMSYEPRALISVSRPTCKKPVDFLQHNTVHAVAGIGHPQQFFSLLRTLHMTPLTHIFPDHHRFQANEIHFPDSLPVVMTEKDAVKCRRLAADERYWYLQIVAKLPASFSQALLTQLGEIKCAGK